MMLSSSIAFIIVFVLVVLVVVFSSMSHLWPINHHWVLYLRTTWQHSPYPLGNQLVLQTRQVSSSSDHVFVAIRLMINSGCCDCVSPWRWCFMRIQNMSCRCCCCWLLLLLHDDRILFIAFNCIILSPFANCCLRCLSRVASSFLSSVFSLFYFIVRLRADKLITSVEQCSWADQLGRLAWWLGWS